MPNEFNDAINSYISDVRKRKRFSFKNISPSKRVERREESLPKLSENKLYIIKKPKTPWQSFADKFTVVEEEDFKVMKEQKNVKATNADQEFEQEYEELAEEGSKTSFFGKIFKFFSPDVESVYKDMDDEEKVEKEAKAQAPPKASPPEQKKKKGSKFLKFFGIDDEEEKEHSYPNGHIEDPSMQKMIEMKEDMKQLAVFVTGVIKKLPKKEYEELKKSPDLEAFKATLRKNNIIK
jgi:hypothetical protein